jgi:hypothetical protein
MTSSATIQSEWEGYRDSCYPQGLSAIQEKECRQAFFSGALLILHRTSEISGSAAEASAIREIEALYRELIEAGKHFSKPQ